MKIKDNIAVNPLTALIGYFIGILGKHTNPFDGWKSTTFVSLNTKSSKYIIYAHSDSRKYR
jgi:hypothetical protein